MTLATVCAFGAAACGSDDETSQPSAAPEATPATAGTDSATSLPTVTTAPVQTTAETTAPPTTAAPTTAAPTTVVDAGPAAEIVGAGFGRSGGSYVRAVVVATANSEAVIGEFATVSVNFLDAAGRIVATVEQVETFSWVGQDLVFPVFVEDEAAEIADMDPIITFSDYGTTEPSRPPLPVLEATEIAEGRSGDRVEVSFEFTNESDENMDLRTGVVCYDQSGAIVGGDSTYPEAAAGRTIQIDVDVAISAEPATCRAFPNYSL